MAASFWFGASIERSCILTDAQVAVNAPAIVGRPSRSRRRTIPLARRGLTYDSRSLANLPKKSCFLRITR